MDIQTVLSRFNSVSHDLDKEIAKQPAVKHLINNENKIISNCDGHLLMADRFMPLPSLLSAEQARLGESLTDTYAALVCFKEFGLEKARADLDLLSFGRAFEFIQSGASEDACGLSTLALDHLGKDAASINIKALSCGEMVALAETYVKKTAQNEDEAFDTYCNFVEFKRDFKTFSETNLDALKQLAEITLLTLPESTAFHLGARVIDGFLTTAPNLVTSYHIDKTVCSGEEWDEISKKLKDRTGFLSETHALRQALANKPAAAAAALRTGASLEPLGLG